MSNLTLTRQRVIAFDETQKEVAEILECTYDEISDMQIDIGCEFVEKYFEKDKLMIILIKKDNMFWNWWRNKWHNIDSCFTISAALSDWSVSLCRSEYERLHDVEKALQTLRPPRFVILPTLKHTA